MLPGDVLVSAVPALSRENLRFFQDKLGCETVAPLLPEGAELVWTVGGRFYRVFSVNKAN